MTNLRSKIPTNDTRSLRTIAKEEGVAYSTFVSRLKRGYSYLAAIGKTDAKKPSKRTITKSAPYGTKLAQRVSFREISRDSGFTHNVVAKHVNEYSLTPEEIIYLGTCPISKYFPKGITLSSLAKTTNLSKKYLEREIRTGRLDVEEVVSAQA